MNNTVRRDRLRVFVCGVQRGKTARELNRKGCQTGETTDRVKEGGGRTVEEADPGEEAAEEEEEEGGVNGCCWERRQKEDLG